VSERVYLSLGSNLGDRLANLRRAVELLETPGVHIARLSSVYETAPVDYLEQPPFLNMVVEAGTELTPHGLLRLTQAIERELGRERSIAKGPRTMDIDIILFGACVIASPELEIPHPRMHERRFVLEPLKELIPDIEHPLLGETVLELLARISLESQPVRIFGPDDRLW
jgi:2-amino-4-hydroxy-6-hydroxymethyldihydropteridine diphosphokinase